MGFWDDEMLARYVTLQHYDSDVDATWSISEEDSDSLQVVYRRKDINGQPDEDFWLYLTPDSAEIIGKILTQWAAARRAAQPEGG
ncbi:hypothetical protein [Paracoccus yeei]|uniref:hypothetical protein n=1 Tax=Paracoccus yeei TaxID=147645 RepID=UPI0028D0F5D5|nr:hypothetical protein [Paracoccus yeei]